MVPKHTVCELTTNCRQLEKSRSYVLLVTADDSCAPTGDKLSAVEIEAKTASSRLHSEDAVSIYSLACTYALLFSVGFPCWLISLARAAIFCAGL